MNEAKAAFFDRMATAPWARDPFGAEDRPKIDRLLVAAELRSGMRVLEPGCGTGRLTEILANAVGPSGRVVALDISAAMVRACRARAKALRHVEVLHTALEEYAGALETFDVAVCHQVFPHFDDAPAAIAAIVRALAPGGRLLVVHFASAAVINERHRAATGPIQQDRLPAPAEMQHLLTAVGLSIDWCTDDGLGYLVRGRRPTPAGN